MIRKVELTMRNRYVIHFVSMVTWVVILVIARNGVAQAQSTFSLGASFYGAIGDGAGTTGLGQKVQKDLNGLGALGYQVVRVWATWATPDTVTPSLITSTGAINENALSRLQNLISYAKTKGIRVDLTFSYGIFTASMGGNFSSYVTGIQNTTIRLNNPAYSNVAFDVCNECNGSGLTNGQMQQLIDTVRFWHPGRQVFLSFAASAAAAASQYNSLGKQLDYLAPHFPRDCSSAWATNTGSRLTTFKSSLMSSYQTIPIYLQEENRRDYTGDGCDDGDSHPPLAFGPIGNGYEVSATDFDTASSQAKNNGSNSARAWVFHNEAGFNLSVTTMCNQFDSVEKSVICDLARNRLGTNCQSPVTCP